MIMPYIIRSFHAAKKRLSGKASWNFGCSPKLSQLDLSLSWLWLFLSPVSDLSQDSCNFDHRGLDQTHHQRGTVDHAPSSAAERCPFQSKAVGEIVSFDLHSALDLIPAANRLIPRVYSAKLNESSWCRQRPCWLRACGRRGGFGVGAWRSAERATDPHRAAVLLETLGRLLHGCLGAVQGWGQGARSTSETRAAPEIGVHLMRLKLRHSSVSGVAGTPVKEIGVFWG